MGRRSLLVANVVEVLEHWAAGRPLRAIAESLGLDRNTVRKYITPAREAGFGPGTGPPPEGWAGFVTRVCPRLGTARRNGAAWEELAARQDEIAERLKVNRPSTVWQRMHDEDGLRASLPSFRRYALATFPEAYSRRPSITVGRDDPPPGEEAQVDFGRLGKWTDPVSGQTMILHAFVLVRSFSRHMFVAVVRRMDAATWLECHVRAFTFFGAAPRRIILDISRAACCTRMCTTRCSTAATPSWPSTSGASSTRPGRQSPRTSLGSSAKCPMCGRASGPVARSAAWRRSIRVPSGGACR